MEENLMTTIQPPKPLGRPPKPPEEKYIQVGLKLPPDETHWLRQNATKHADSISRFILDAIRARIASLK